PVRLGVLVKQLDRVPRRVRLAGALGFIVACLAIAISLRSAREVPPVVVPISELLNLADHHDIDRVTISGNSLIAMTKLGLQYRASKEDQQAVTEQLRADGITVTVVDASSGAGSGIVTALLPILFVVV